MSRWKRPTDEGGSGTTEEEETDGGSVPRRVRSERDLLDLVWGPESLMVSEIEFGEKVFYLGAKFVGQW